MQTLHYVVVEVDSAYNNEKQITEDLSIVVNSTIESVEHINRIARVVSAPDFTVLRSGDEVIIHHNICRVVNGYGGVVQSNFHIEDNKYFVPLTEVYMYKRDEDWIALDPYCFVEPIKGEEYEGEIKLIDTSDKHKGNVRNTGILSYSNTMLREEGFVEGDTIFFSNDSEYEFEIDNKIYYKMSFRDILGKLE